MLAARRVSPVDTLASADCKDTDRVKDSRTAVSRREPADCRDWAGRSPHSQKWWRPWARPAVGTRVVGQRVERMSLLRAGTLATEMDKLSLAETMEQAERLEQAE